MSRPRAPFVLFNNDRASDMPREIQMSFRSVVALTSWLKALVRRSVLMGTQSLHH